MQLKITENQHDPSPYWLQPLPDAYVDQIIHQGIELFDQNGYDMCRVEQVYAQWNGYQPKEHREKFTNKEVWMVDIDEDREKRILTTVICTKDADLQGMHWNNCTK